ncbi:MAG: hypothetical protein FWD50_00665 [Betaproteobacteria bacterium]|nr:hypothetical protein [Betaproteobacteria bacterium]
MDKKINCKLSGKSINSFLEPMDERHGFWAEYLLIAILAVAIASVVVSLYLYE